MDGGKREKWWVLRERAKVMQEWRKELLIEGKDKRKKWELENSEKTEE